MSRAGPAAAAQSHPRRSPDRARRRAGRGRGRAGVAAARGARRRASPRRRRGSLVRRRARAGATGSLVLPGPRTTGVRSASVRGAAGTGRDTLVRALLAMAGAPALRKTCYELRGGADRLEPELGGFAAVWDARQGDPSPDDMHLASTWLERSPTLAVAVLDRHQDAPEIPGRQLVLLETDAGA